MSKIKARERDTEVISGWQCCQERREGQTLEYLDTGQGLGYRPEIILTKRAWAESQEKARREEPWKGCNWWPQMQQKLGEGEEEEERED